MLRFNFVFFILFIAINFGQSIPNFRPPSVPLVTHDPNFSLWSGSDNLTDSEIVHWTLHKMALRSLINIDGNIYRVMGQLPAFTPALEQKSVEVKATRTIYKFTNDKIELSLTFLSPLFCDDIKVLSRPVSYITWEIESIDNKPHAVEIYFDMPGAIAVDKQSQKVKLRNTVKGNLRVLSIGTVDQKILHQAGDNIRIDWGYAKLAADTAVISSYYLGTLNNALINFALNKPIKNRIKTDTIYKVGRDKPITAITMQANLTANKKLQRHVLIGYDDIYSVEFFHDRLLPYWRKEFNSFEDLLIAAEKEYLSISKKSELFDFKLENTIVNNYGIEYAQICNLAYRQSIAAHKLVLSNEGELLCFSKENASNGSMGTVDVFYPASPIFLYFNPELLKAQMVPIFEYAKMERWKFPYAPHDLGKYPLGNGQKYGGGEISEERQMPVEESGNMIILTAAIAILNNDSELADKYWDIISNWAKYLKEKGFDPKNQLCTDDFAGHLAHNTNLSVKAIVALACYAKLCELKNKNTLAKEYSKLAKEMAIKWETEAKDGDHYRLAFDKPNTWSMKYNLIWDQILRLNLFPPKVYSQEISFYKKNQNTYGLQLDNRKDYSKLDWIVWTASLSDNNNDFNELIAPIYKFLMESPDRVPMSDWYDSKSGAVVGFRARSVVGGVFIKILKDKVLKK